MGPGVSPPDFGALHRSTQAKVRLHTAWGPRLPQPRSGSGQAAARARRDTPASPARRAVPALFCCDSEKDAGWGRPGCFPGRVRAALRPSAGAPARSAGHRERGATRTGQAGAPGPGLGHPWPSPAASSPRAAPRAEHLGQWLLLRPPIPRRSPSAPTWGMGRTGRLRPDGAGSAALARGFRRAAGSAWGRPGSPLPAGSPESTGTGSQLPAAPRPLHPSGSPWA